MATECARSTCGPRTTIGKSAAAAGKIVSSKRWLNHASVSGIFLTQSPPSLYLPDVYSLPAMPSALAMAITRSASRAGISGSTVTLIRSRGNLNIEAKSSGGTLPIGCDATGKVRDGGGGSLFGSPQ